MTLNYLIFVAEIATPKGEMPMEFLEEILGGDLYSQVKEKISSYNEKADKSKKVSIVNVNNGEFVAKAKYSQLEADLNNTKISLDTANTTIADLKKNNGDNADLQAKISEYETKYKEEKTKMLKEIAIKDALYNAKAKHPELLLSKFDFEKIVLDEKGEKVVSGIEEQVKTNKETYKDLFENVEQAKPAYHYTPASGNESKGTGTADFVEIIKENQARRI